MKKTRKKKLEMPMEFNPGLQKYEPVFTLRKTNKQIKLKISWKRLTFIAIILLILLITGFFVLRYFY
ncbi:hypothetical protein J4466_03965 [Candidatus Pacearchaeota archaeon]|nr:hypothetical protein [Candidatus Pacearchaeota archaeon]